MAAHEDDADVSIEVEETPAETAESTEEKPEEIDAVC